MSKRGKKQAGFPTLPIIFFVLSIFLLIFTLYQFKISSSYQRISENITNSETKITQALTSPTPTLITTPKVEEVYQPQTLGNQLKVPILMYHYISDNPDPKDVQRDSLATSPFVFDNQLRYLKENGYHTISLDTLYAALKKQVTLPNKSIILTFDDGYIDFFINAYPILQKYNFQATVFIPTGLMDQGYYLQWDQIKQMQDSGLISFQAHTVNHAQLTILPTSSALWEMTESKKVLQEKLGIPVNFMAYPYGSANSTVIELSKQAGFVGAVGTWRGDIQSEGTIYNLPRIRINGTVSLDSFITLLQ